MFNGNLIFSRFQSTLPRGERLFHSFLSRPILHYFNPRSREGSDSAVLALVPISSQFQSTLPRGERRYLNPRIVVNGTISIHAPARGATKEKSAPARISSFQSTLPRGERLYSGQYTCSSCAISIHAPARGATPLLYFFYIFHQFQSTLPRGERHGLFSICNIITVFQSTLPRGERLAQLVYLVDGVHYFNPRSREGSDWRRKRHLARSQKFQSTLPRGERHTAHTK